MVFVWNKSNFKIVEPPNVNTIRVGGFTHFWATFLFKRKLPRYLNSCQPLFFFIERTHYDLYVYFWEKECTSNLFFITTLEKFRVKTYSYKVILLNPSKTSFSKKIIWHEQWKKERGTILQMPVNMISGVFY